MSCLIGSHYVIENGKLLDVSILKVELGLTLWYFVYLFVTIIRKFIHVNCHKYQHYKTVNPKIYGWKYQYTFLFHNMPHNSTSRLQQISISFTSDAGYMISSLTSVSHLNQNVFLLDLLKKYLTTDAKCLELFARNLTPGWTCWGNEVSHLMNTKDGLLHYV